MKHFFKTLLIALLAGPACAGPISGYPAATTPLTGTETAIGTQSGTTVQLSTQSIASLAISGIAGYHVPACTGSGNDEPAFAAAAALGPVLVANETCNIATTFTTTSSVTVYPGGVISPNGVALHLNGGFSAPLTKVLNLVAGGVVTFGDGTIGPVHPEWWGAVTDSSGAAAANVAAINAAHAAITKGVVQLEAGQYYVNAVIGPTVSYQVLAGRGSNETQIVNTSTTADTVEIEGAGSGSYLDGDKLIGFSTYRSSTVVNPTTGTTNADGTLVGAKGVRVYWAANAIIQDVVPSDDYIGFYSFDTTGSLFSDNRAVRGNPGMSSYKYFGFVADGSGTPAAGTSANGSLVVRNLDINSKGFLGASDGVYSFGDIRDQWYDVVQASPITNGMVFVGGSNLEEDVNITNPVIDGFSGTGISVTNTGYNGMMTIQGGWSSPALAATGPNVSVAQFSLTITGHKFFGGVNPGNQTGFLGAACLSCTVSNNVFKDMNYGVELSSSSILSTIDGNTFLNSTGGGNGTDAIFITSSSRITIANNTVQGVSGTSWVNGIATTGSDQMMFSGNVVNPSDISNHVLDFGGASITAQGLIGGSASYAYGVLN